MGPFFSHPLAGGLVRIVRGVATVSSVLLIDASAAHGQLAAALDFGGGVGQVGSAAWQRESRIAPTLRLSHGVGFLQADGSAIERGGKLSLRSGAVEGAINSPAFGVFRSSLSGRFLHDAAQPVAHATSANIAAALSAKLGSSGAWIGTSRPNDARLQLDLGAWRMFGAAIFSVTSQRRSMNVVGGLRTRVFPDSQFNDTSGTWHHFDRTVSDSSASRMERWSDVEARVDWSHGRLALSAAISGRRTRDSVRAMTWGRVNATLQVSPRVSLIAGGGTLPSAGSNDVATARFATLGVRLAPSAFLRPPLPVAVRPAASAFRVERQAAGTVKMILRVPNARTVEVSGDFNQWTPIALREIAPDTWEATVSLAPGTHRVNVRVDGERWTAPPGLPVVDDEFTGRVGILIVR
jgi:hypothetical protein